MKSWPLSTATLVIIWATAAGVSAIDITEHVSIGGVLAGTYQYEWVSGPPGAEDRGRGAVPFQPEISIKPTESDEVFFKFGFAAGNGLNAVTPFVFAPWERAITA
jgi:porin